MSARSLHAAGVAAKNGGHPAGRYLRALFGRAPRGAYVELRCRSARGMDCTYWPAADLDAVERAIDTHAMRTDVYVGVLLRRSQGGSRGDLAGEGAVIWLDCDSAGCTRALAGFRPQPSIAVASGTGGNLHAYWLLHDAAALDDIERANRVIAHELGGDLQCTDAGRILRPPSWNHKHDPPRPVRLLRCESELRRHLGEIAYSG